MRPVNIVWFKRDLRTVDHEPLNLSIKSGFTLGLFIIEPLWLSSPEFDSSHYEFVRQSLLELQERLSFLGVPLLIRIGSADEVFLNLINEYKIQGLFSHEETGLDWTYKRDLLIKDLCKTHGIVWKESLQFGVIRRLKNRDDWPQKRTRILSAPVIKEFGQDSSFGRCSVESSPVPTCRDLGILPSTKIYAQLGGRKEGIRYLDSFLRTRCEKYTYQMSSPLTAFDGCSRISPYLSWGVISMKEVLTWLNNRKLSLNENSKKHFLLKKQLDAFESRLWWHCHFIQKLETEPELEFQNMNRSFDGMRESEFCERKFDAWKKGETGIPMIDACMRALHQHGWINFRMRAMLISFASYQLWLHWRKPAQYLASQFIDFEPGIHFPQVQMQSGVTGINMIRVYSPTKQVLDRDPRGEFIKTYIPELAELDPRDLTAPHKIPPLLGSSYNFRIGRDYPEPIVDPEKSYQEAKDKIFKWRSLSEVKKMSRSVLERHTNRKVKHEKRN